MDKKSVLHLLKHISDKLQVCASIHLKECGVTISQINVIDCIDENGGSATQKKIESHLNVSHPTVKGIITRLEKKDFLYCYPDETDKRNKIVSLTEKATSTLSTMYAARQNLEEHILRGLSKEEITELTRLLEIIYQNI